MRHHRVERRLAAVVATTLLALGCEAGGIARDPGAAPAGSTAVDTGAVGGATGDAGSTVAPTADAGSRPRDAEPPRQTDAAIPTADAGARHVPDAASPGPGWPEPLPPSMGGLTMVVDGRRLQAGETLRFDTAPAGLRDAWTEARITLTNRGDAPLTLSTEAADWLDAPGFSLVDAPPAELAAGGTVAVRVRFDPAVRAEGGDVQATLTVPAGDASAALTLLASVPPPLRMVVLGDGGLQLVSDDYGASFELVAGEEADATARHTITWGAGRFFRGFAIGPEWGDPAVYEFSDDGVSWARARSSDRFWPSECTYGLGRFVCVVAAGVAWSEDGEGVVHEEAGCCPMFNAVAFGDGRFVGVGRDNRLAASEDGVTWAWDRREHDPDWLAAVAYGDGRFVAGGGERTDREYLAISSDGGESWDVRIDPDEGAIQSVVWHRGRWVVGARRPARVMTSDDGDEWETHYLDDIWETRWLLGAVNGWFFATYTPWEQPATIYRSRDGVDWEPVYSTPNPRYLRAMAVEGWPR